MPCRAEPLLTGISPEEEAAYTQRRDFPQREAIRAINAFGAALEKMSRGTDQRIELELAVFSLTQPEITAAAAVVVQQVAAPAAPQAFASAPPVQPAATIVAPRLRSQALRLLLRLRRMICRRPLMMTHRSCSPS